MSSRKLHEVAAWEAFCKKHKKEGGSVPTWLSNMGSWSHSQDPQTWNEKGQELVKKILKEMGPIVLKALGVPPALATVVVDLVSDANKKEKKKKDLPTKEACKELERERRKEAWKKKYHKKKDKSQASPILKNLFNSIISR